ncbi:TetR/AcrR family transcriptional regulator [Microbacterium murale]|uniref:AcrR family transcriptional regulator n=1 Tax=Microbacterium murale TaxID=1081040 RepID=A0ABU0P763_9MICO|nr:TetR/AcrR family transcriptional regulator [Microbacterium murale]MDQ0643171.1 AcrR family transcriptional regulator [Microbacterium murale]
MQVASQQLGRRERNKQAKLDRITAAATELFAKHGVDDVTTQQIADAADIGTGTLFLYAKTKGELLLLVQNARYATALERGRSAAADAPDVLAGVLALVAPVVECNRTQVDNGRTYLREMVFGDPSEPHHAEALSIVGQTEAAIAATLIDRAGLDAPAASTIARVVSAIMFLEMAASVNAGSSNQEILASIRSQVAAILPSGRS